MKASVSILMITILVTAFFAADAHAVVDMDIVLAMPFDEGEGRFAKDLSPHGNHGTLVENAEWGVGKFGNAIHVKPVGYVDAGNDRSLRLFRSDFTLAVWVSMKETQFSQHAFIAKDEGAGFLNKWILGYCLNGDPMFNINTLIIKDGGGFTRSSDGFGGEVQPKTWHQVAMVRRPFFNDGFFEEDYTYYLDGKQVGRSAMGSNVDDNDLPRFIDTPVTIGWAEVDIALDGFIDEVLIAKRAFTAEEITTHFNSGVKGVLGLAVKPEGKSAAVWGNVKADILR